MGGKTGSLLSSVTLFEQGLTQVLQAAVTGLAPKQPYMLALARNREGVGPLEPLAKFMTNPAGSAIVNAVGPIRQLVITPGAPSERRFLVIVSAAVGAPTTPVQLQTE